MNLPGSLAILEEDPIDPKTNSIQEPGRTRRPTTQNRASSDPIQTGLLYQTASPAVSTDSNLGSATISENEETLP